MAQDPIDLPDDALPVEIVNDPLKVVVTDTVKPVHIVGPMYYPSELRSLSGDITAKAGKRKRLTLQFNETVLLHEFTFAPLKSAGSCQIQIRINELLVKVLEWEPPVGIVFNPNDYITIRLRSLADEGDGVCSAKYVVLATTMNGNGN